jgi:hypothetical protein
MTEPTRDVAEARTWTEFQESGMLWLINRTLHLFGWAIVLHVDDVTGEVVGAGPRRTVWRGFPIDAEERGFRRVSAWMRENAVELERDLDREGQVEP